MSDAQQLDLHLQTLCFKAGDVNTSVPTGYDYTQLVNRAYWHGILPQLMQALVEKDLVNTWPNAARERVKAILRTYTAVDLIRRRAVKAVLTASHDKGIEVVAIKGLALGHDVYSNPGLRWAVDCDLFIDFSAIESFKSLVRRHSFLVQSPIYKSHQFKAELSLHPPARAALDIHWRVNNTARYARALGFREIWIEGRVVPELPGGRIPNHIHALVIAVIHLAASDPVSQQRAIWASDIALLANSLTESEWEELWRFVSDRELANELFSGLLFAQSWIQTTVPSEFLNNLQVVAGKRSAKARLRHSNLALLADDFLKLNGIKSRLQLLRELFFPTPGELQSRSSPGPRLPLILQYLHYWVGGVWRRLSLR